MPVKANVKISTLGYVIVYVKDTKAAIPFYKDILGMTLKLDDDGWVEFETGATTFCLHRNKELGGECTNGQALPVFSVEDFHGTVEALKTAGVKLLKEPVQVCEAGPDKTGMSIEFKDPDGNVLSIFGYVTK
ncbi:VOC family protein [soil metagenome]